MSLDKKVALTLALTLAFLMGMLAYSKMADDLLQKTEQERLLLERAVRVLEKRCP